MGFLRFFGVDGTRRPDGGVSRLISRTSYGLRLSSFNTSFLLLYLGLGLDMWIFSMGDSGKIKNITKKGDASPPVACIQFGNPPPLLPVDLSNRHSLAILLLVSSLVHTYRNNNT